MITLDENSRVISFLGDKKLHERYLEIKGTKMIGRHLVMDLFDITNIPTEEFKDLFEQACLDTGATILDTRIQEYGPGCGTTGVVILAESHLSWHHYPESNAIFIDIFTCGNCDPRLAAPRIREAFKPRRYNQAMMNRGVVSE